MYSLYRAWLSMSTQPPELPPLNLSAPNTSTATSPTQTTNAPDVQLQVGPSLTNFSAHRNVLAAHSGFFKAALNNFATPTTATTPSSTPIGPILVPNIAVDEFSSLLTFMYTGYLDLNLANIYNILLATHILHMPRALELCRNFLMAQQQQQQQQQQQIECHPVQAPPFEGGASPLIVKPIPSRKPLPNIEIIGSKFSDVQREGEKKIFKNSVFKVYKNAAAASENVEESRNEPSTSTTVGKTEDKREKTSEKPKKEKKRRISHLVAQASCTIGEEQRVIVDIACCDGPVRFHRIVNKNYGRKTTSPLVDTPTGGGLQVNNEDDCLKRQRTSTLAAINKIMTENIKLASSENSTTESDTNNTSTNTQPSIDLYTCLYCNHTFKSQYCYQKHARRHLNPVDAVKTPIDGSAHDKQPTGNCSSSSSSSATTTGAAAKREFKLLDMNVQYYPCKTCGSKFPSYYFVHKHRKLCHADEMADGSNKNNEIVQVKPKKCKTSSSSAAATCTSATMTAASHVDDENSNEKHDSHEDDNTTSDIIDVEETN